MEKNLKYFMRKEMLEEKIVEVPAPESFKDENGNPIMMKIRCLSRQHIDSIQEGYKKLVPAIERKTGRPYLNNGKMVMQDETDSNKALRHLVVEALEFPNLKDEELMKFYNCIDAIDMPLLMFNTSEYLDIVHKVNRALGLETSIEEEETKDDINAAKN